MLESVVLNEIVTTFCVVVVCTACALVVANTVVRVVPSGEIVGPVEVEVPGMGAPTGVVVGAATGAVSAPSAAVTAVVRPAVGVVVYGTNGSVTVVTGVRAPSVVRVPGIGVNMGGVVVVFVDVVQVLLCHISAPP